MKRRRFTPEKIIGLLRQAEVELAQGKRVSEVCRGLGISEMREVWVREPVRKRASSLPARVPILRSLSAAVLIGVQDLRLRCIMASYDPDTLIQDKNITRDIYRRFGGKLALNSFVIEGGDIAAGDEVQLVRGRACAAPELLAEQRMTKDKA